MLSEIISNLIRGHKKKMKEEMNLHKNPIKTFTAHALQYPDEKGSKFQTLLHAASSIASKFKFLS